MRLGSSADNRSNILALAMGSLELKEYQVPVAMATGDTLNPEQHIDTGCGTLVLPTGLPNLAIDKCPQACGVHGLSITRLTWSV